MSGPNPPSTCETTLVTTEPEEASRLSASDSRSCREEVVITIDGPAGAGKSTAARGLAERLGFAFLDTGAMYRSVTLACLRAGVDWDNDEAIRRVARAVDIRVDDKRVYLDGQDVSAEIRTPEVTRHIRSVADHPEVRSLLCDLQRRIAAGLRIVTEGRDQGSDVFPHADCKFFLTASPETRARRRQAELHGRGQIVTYEEVLAAQTRRDQEDASRPVGALRAAPDAVVIQTDRLSHAQVIDHLVHIVVAKELVTDEDGR